MNAVTKAEWRALLRGRRKARHAPDDGAGLAAAGLAWLASIEADGPAEFTDRDSGRPSVCAYISGGNEPPTGPLLEALVAAGFLVYVPVCEPDFQLSWTRWQPGADLARSALAPVMEPVGPRFAFKLLGHVGAILVPALAVDSSGVRLGQGGGYFDRFLAALPSGTQPGRPGVPLAAVVHDDEVFPAGLLPHDSHDAAVAFALTPSGHQALG